MYSLTETGSAANDTQIACRSEKKIDDATLNKVARSCQVDREQVITVWDLETIYQVPLMLQDQGLLHVLTAGLGLDKLSLSEPRIQQGSALWDLWKKTVVPKQHWEPVNIVLVGKYTALDDAYISVRKSLEHSAMRCKRKLKLISVDSEHLEDETMRNDPTKYHRAWNTVCEAQGVVVPGEDGNQSRRDTALLTLHSRRLLDARHRRHDQDGAVGSRAQGAVHWPLPGHAGGRDGGGAQPLRARGRHVGRV